MINVVLYLMILAILGYAGILYASPPMLLIAFSGVLFFILACLYLILELFTLRIGFSLPISMTEKGKKAELEIRIQNKSIFPVSRMRLFFCCQNELTGGRKRVVMNAAADARSETLVYQSIEGESCGNLVYTLRRIRVYDLTGIFYLTKWSRISGQLNVMPLIYETAVTVTEQSRHFMGDADFFDDVKAGPDVSEVLEIRPFRDGDRVQNIHWKRSAREKELMVKERSLPLGCPVVLLLDLSDMRRNMDAFLSLVSGISCALTEQRCTHYISWYSGCWQDIKRVRIGREEDLYLFLLTLYEENKKRRSVDIREGYHEKYQYEQVVTEIYINQNLEIFTGGEAFVKLTAKGLEKKLGEVEFIV